MNQASLLKLCGEPTRLRLLSLLSQGDLSVKDMMSILGQSQPRISRHLKLLHEAGLIDRYPEGSWVYYRLVQADAIDRLLSPVMSSLQTDSQIIKDHQMRRTLMQAHAIEAERYFNAEAENWDNAIQASQQAGVDAAIREILQNQRIYSLLDLGTGTGHMLEVLHPVYDKALGIDRSQAMLRYARARLDRLSSTKAEVRHGDILNLSLPSGHFDLITLHQVLHYFDDPASLFGEASRCLAPSGRLLIVDYAPHDFEALRDNHAHRRLGFETDFIARQLDVVGCDLIESQSVPVDLDGGHKLTVMLWLGQDRRIEVA